MKKILLGALLLTTVFTGGVFMGKQMDKEDGKVAISNITKENNKVITDFTDGSWSVVNEKEGTFVFQPVDMGDWDYNCKDINQLNDVIGTYLNMKNNGEF